MRVLLTGGAGFIGSHVADALLAAGHAVRVVDHLHPAAHDREPDYLPDGVEWQRGDLRAASAAAEAVGGVDAICHQAAMVGLGVDLSDITDYVAHNDLGTAQLLGALAARGFRGPLVLASSMVVYGEGRYTCADHGVVAAPPRSAADLDAGRFEPRCPRCAGDLTPATVGEDAPVDPRNVYAATKLHQEHLVGAFARETGVRAVALRYHNVYGPRMPRDTPYAGVASIFRSRLEAGEAPRVTEDGGQLRDFVHVRDVAAANLLALEGEASGAYNVASGTPRSVGEMARALHAATGGSAPPPEVTGAWRAGDVRHVFASTDRITRELGYAPTVDFATGMTEFATARLR